MADLKAPQTTASKLRAMLAQDGEIMVCPGVYDGFTARLALNAGFKILYMVLLPLSDFALKMGADSSRQEQEPPCPVLE
jgi:2-methylisocitrate lyase-like PEP mutase family enzyme